MIDIVGNTIDFRALAWGRPGDRLALLLHGYPDTAYTWRHLGPELAARGYRAVAPFTRGYAPTGLAPDDSYRVADLVADTLALHDRLGDERAVLVGHDWGALTAWGVAATAPGRFARVAALAVPPPAAFRASLTDRRQLRVSLRQIRMSWYVGYNQVPGSERLLPRVIPALWRDWSPGYDAGEDVQHVLAALARPEHRRAALRYYRSNLGLLRADSPTAAAQQPALYLHGAQDGCLQAALVQAHPETLPAGSRHLVLPALGHFLHLEDPALVNRHIVDWLDADLP
ncbi:alpha/beta hydrolase [Skermania piniformis]|uniref:Alpha/beta hydrolase n=2 Tax=Skermania pinensis TaxID=39122 RepID=A0ABX8SCJ9_9ACTN|nr:alpha/beta hydrolase [Skermania piniformis]